MSKMFLGFVKVAPTGKIVLAAQHASVEGKASNETHVLIDENDDTKPAQCFHMELSEGTPSVIEVRTQIDKFVSHVQLLPSNEEISGES